MKPLIAPTYLKLNNKKYSLNLNVYRNTHYQILNKLKIKFKEELANQINQLEPMSNIHITYVLFTGSHRLCDVANVCSVVDKFFMDAIVSANKLPDDNYNYLPKITYMYGGYIKDQPHVKIYIENMK